MTALTIHLPDRDVKRLRERAEAVGVSEEEFVLASLRDRLEADRAFEAAAHHVVEKNAELYRRLA